MAIFLGKNYLGQKDKQEIEQTPTQIIFIDNIKEFLMHKNLNLFILN